MGQRIIDKPIVSKPSPTDHVVGVSGGKVVRIPVSSIGSGGGGGVETVEVVFSQLQKWTKVGDRYTYTMSEQNYQFVSVDMIDYLDMWGIEYQDDKKYFCCNELFDLSYCEALAIAQLGYVRATDMIGNKNLFVRTTIGLLQPELIFNQFAHSNSQVEIINLNEYGSSAQSVCPFLMNEGATADNMFYGCSHLSRVLGTIQFEDVTTAINAFYKCRCLEEIQIAEVNCDLNFSACSVLSFDSLSFIADNSSPSHPITIKVPQKHFDAMSGIGDEFLDYEVAMWVALKEQAENNNISFSV